MISEKYVADLWRRQRKVTFTADNGALIHVIFPGRPAYGGGCDFTDSVFLNNGITVTGNIEVHSRLRDWYAHGHDNDPRYGDIVLHVVMQHGNCSARLYDGSAVPTISLESAVSSILSPLPVCDYAAGYQPQGMTALLVSEGYGRFLERAKEVEVSCHTIDTDRVLLRNIASALGYSRNVRQFQKLADALPADIKQLSLSELTAVLFGIAGLLPSQRRRFCKDRYTATIEAIWRSSGYYSILDNGDWCFSGVRPDNRPARRIAAFAYLIHRFNDRGLLKGICRLIDAAPSDNGHRLLERQLVIDGGRYWAAHIDFGAKKRAMSALLGGQRVCDMLMSVLLPSVYALSPRLSEKALHLYMTYPRRGDNEITRYMQGQLSLQSMISGCGQQGIIRLFKRYCRTRDCMHCPVAIRRG